MQKDNIANRRHVRHITGLPVQITLDYATHYYQHTGDDSITNVSLGGMSFIADDRFDIEQTISVRFPILNDQTTLNCKVIWCEKTSRGYEVGLKFDEADEILRLKMIDQISDIENFRQRMEAIEGRAIGSEQALREWVKRYADHFSTLQ